MTDEIKTTPVNRDELKPCTGCGKGLLHTGQPLFYELTLTQCIADIRSIQQQHGLEMMLGTAAPLAAVLAPSTTIAHRMPPVHHFLCADCVLRGTAPLVFLEPQGS